MAYTTTISLHCNIRMKKLKIFPFKIFLLSNRNYSVNTRQVKELHQIEKVEYTNDSSEKANLLKTNDKNTEKGKNQIKKVKVNNANKKKKNSATAKQDRTIEQKNSSSQKECQIGTKKTDTKTNKVEPEITEKVHHHHHHHHHKNDAEFKKQKKEHSDGTTDERKTCDELLIKKFKKISNRDTIPGNVSAKLMKTFLESVGEKPVGTKDDLFRQIKSFFSRDKNEQDCGERPSKKSKVVEE